MSSKIFTIGHSNHPINKFIDLLKQHGVTALADVRSTPYSRYLPHFCQNSLKAELNAAGIHYVFLGKELGARPEDRSCYVDGKALYERIAATALFHQGLARLISGTQKLDIALMCAEKDPLTCHRAVLVCQNLRNQPLNINHILPDGDIETHTQLENRMLKAHGFDNFLPQEMKDADPSQLDLFGSTQVAPSDDSHNSHAEVNSRDQALTLAYQHQGSQIAYVEKSYAPVR